MIRSFPPHPNPLPPGEREDHSSPQQSWGVFWHIFINTPRIVLRTKRSNLMGLLRRYVHHRNDIVR
ncbi:MAG: hypothetical protein WCO26_13230, partial [Deltaproteobacteria bacterium]